jgi:hypothetical protein
MFGGVGTVAAFQVLPVKECLRPGDQIRPVAGVFVMEESYETRSFLEIELSLCVIFGAGHPHFESDEDSPVKF